MQHCNMQQAFSVWWKNGKTVKRSHQTQKTSGSSVTTKGEAKKTHVGV